MPAPKKNAALELLKVIKKIPKKGSKTIKKANVATTGFGKAMNKGAKYADKAGPTMVGKKLKMVDSKDSFVKVNKNKNIKKELTRADRTPPYTSRKESVSRYSSINKKTKPAVKSMPVKKNTAVKKRSR